MYVEQISKEVGNAKNNIQLLTSQKIIEEKIKSETYSQLMDVKLQLHNLESSEKNQLKNWSDEIRTLGKRDEEWNCAYTQLE